MFLSGVDQGIKTNSEWLISTDQCTFSDTKEAWLHFVLLSSRKIKQSRALEGTIKQSRMIFTNQDSWSQSQALLQVAHMWLPLDGRPYRARKELHCQSEGPCWKCHRKLQVVWHMYVSIMYNRLTILWPDYKTLGTQCIWFIISHLVVITWSLGLAGLTLM